jgi:hypothetical protein
MSQINWTDIEREYYADRLNIKQLSQRFNVPIPVLNDRIRKHKWTRKAPKQVIPEYRDQAALEEAFRLKEEREAARIAAYKEQYEQERKAQEEELQNLIDVEINFV